LGRHDFQCAELDRGVPLHAVRDWVGQKNIATTNIYANTTATQLDAGRDRFESAKIDARLPQTPDRGDATPQNAGNASDVKPLTVN